jgi:DNA-binding CsgD family transcriptional regulator
MDLAPEAGVDRRAHELFRLILGDAQRSEDAARYELGLSEAEFVVARQMLIRAGLLRLSADVPGYAPVSPENAVARLLALEERETARHISAVREQRATLSALTENLLALQAETRSGPRIRLLKDRQAVLAAMDEAADTVQTEALSMHPVSPLPRPLLEDGMTRNRAIRARGVRLRSIHLDAMAQVPHGRAHLQALREAGGEVRLAAVLPFRLVLVDDALAFVSTPTALGESAALEITGRDVCWLLRQTFDYCWVHATAPPDVAADSSCRDGVSEREIAMIRMLAAGGTDEATAQALGVSTRTLRRMLTGAMDKLGAETRFQAGARASALGLLD